MLPDPRMIAANVGLGQDKLETADGLAAYLQKQVELIGERLPEAKIAGPQVSSFPGAEEAYLLLVKHSVDAVGTMIHLQRYVRVGLWVGIVTLTTPETQLSTVRPDYDNFVQGLRFLGLQEATAAQPETQVAANREESRR